MKVSKMFFNMPAAFAEFEADLLRMKAPAIARSRGRLKGRRPKAHHLTHQQAGLVGMHASGPYTIVGLMEVFSVGRATVRRVPYKPTVGKRRMQPTSDIRGEGS